MLTGAAAPYTLPVVDGQVVDLVKDHPVIVMGYDLYNPGASPAVFYLRDGRSVADPIRIPISLAAGESTSDYFLGGKLFSSGGVFFDSISGTATLVGTLWIA